MSWELTDCTLPDEKEKVQVTYLKNNKEYLDDKTYRKLKELGYKIDMIAFVPKICSISWL